jgi:hypothetical protein
MLMFSSLYLFGMFLVAQVFAFVLKVAGLVFCRWISVAISAYPFQRLALCDESFILLSLQLFGGLYL